KNGGNVSFLSTGLSKSGPRGLESRQKTEEMSHFCLLDSPNPVRAVSKADKKRRKCLIFVYQTLQIRSARSRKQTKNGGNVSFLSTGLSKSGPRGLESITKSSKIEKIFYSVPFAKTVLTQITDTSQKSPSCSQPNSGEAIEQVMSSTEFVKITVVYGQITVK
ncbi:hypothetical protein ACTQ2W_04695, partial [Ligilactobacillus ruminis]|uniref:hypothetical protein n=1 Tax=Ligilactobacillus ruminis TaxID=1623 RepID=UPI003F948576